MSWRKFQNVLGLWCYETAPWNYFKEGTFDWRLQSGGKFRFIQIALRVHPLRLRKWISNAISLESTSLLLLVKWLIRNLMHMAIDNIDLWLRPLSQVEDQLQRKTLDKTSQSSTIIQDETAATDAKIEGSLMLLVIVFSTTSQKTKGECSSLTNWIIVVCRGILDFLEDLVSHITRILLEGNMKLIRRRPQHSSIFFSTNTNCSRGISTSRDTPRHKTKMHMLWIKRQHQDSSLIPAIAGHSYPILLTHSYFQMMARATLYKSVRKRMRWLARQFLKRVGQCIWCKDALFRRRKYRDLPWGWTLMQWHLLQPPIHKFSVSVACVLYLVVCTLWFPQCSLTSCPATKPTAQQFFPTYHLSVSHPTSLPILGRVPQYSQTSETSFMPQPPHEFPSFDVQVQTVSETNAQQYAPVIQEGNEDSSKKSCWTFEELIWAIFASWPHEVTSGLQVLLQAIYQLTISCGECDIAFQNWRRYCTCKADWGNPQASVVWPFSWLVVFTTSILFSLAEPSSKM